MPPRPSAKASPQPTQTVTRAHVLAFRAAAQQLDAVSTRPADATVLDVGVQDSASDGGLWALANRGVDIDALTPRDLVTLWTLRAAPHLYRRDDLSAVAAAVAPLSAADAARRVVSAAKPLAAAGIDPLHALDVVAGELRRIVTAPMVKGDVSSQVTSRVPEPYLGAVPPLPRDPRLRDAVPARRRPRRPRAATRGRGGGAPVAARR